MPRTLSAMVIGNANYSEVETLRNPGNDATDVGDALESLGFSVLRLIDATTEEMDRGLTDFAASLAISDVGLFFFAGHAFQIEGINFLAGVDTKAYDPLAIQYSALHLDKIVSVMKKTPSLAERASFIILDACRNNPFEGLSRSVASTELAPVFAPKGMLLAFSTSPGEKSGDGAGRNGSYTVALLNHIKTSDLPIETMFKRVRNTLATLTNGRQTSWEHTSLLGDFHFRLSTEAPVLEYGRTAIADGLFLVKESQPGHAVIKRLRILTWDYQNKALEGLTDEVVSLCTADTLFVIGRNIYQAACGHANAATSYVERFMEKTEGMDPSKRKSLLDGMLFEIFFDGEGIHRKSIKEPYFNEVFRLQEYDETKASFEFVQSCLTPYLDEYYSLPGTNQPVRLDVAAEDPLGGETYVISAVWFEGTNILQPRTIDTSSRWSRNGLTFTPEKWQQYASENLAIPIRLLTIVPDFNETARSLYELPHTVTLDRWQ